MRKNKMMRLASVLLVAVLMTTCAISGTFAKYVSSATGTDTAKVAKWDVKVGGTTINNSNTFTFDLFNTIIDTKTGATEGDISDATGSIIAPGTKGSFQLVLNNASEVSAEYTVHFSATNPANIPVLFCLTEGGTYKSDITSLNITDAQGLAIGATDTITVYWMWAFEGDNVADTNLGLNGSAEITVAARVDVTQID